MKRMTAPYVRPKAPVLSKEELDEQARRIKELRAEIESEWAEQEQLRRMLVSAVEGIKDVEAAVNCHCACHGKPGKLHDRGVSCACQKTAEERKEALNSFWEWSAEEVERWAAQRAASEKAVMDEAERLAVEVTSHGGAAPYVICGVVDGRAFFFRERHDAWRVEIAGDQEPLVNPWRQHDAESIVVAEGLSDGLMGDDFEIEALRVAVEAVRTFLQRRSCDHAQEGAWCSKCGVRLEEAEKWRIWT